MDWLRRKRIKQIITYGWKDSAIIAKDSGKNRLKVFCNIIQCFRKYFVFSYQYKKNGLWKLDSQEFHSQASKLGEANLSHDRWVIENYENHKFLEKWTKKKWEKNSNGSLKRKEAYTKFFKTGKDLHVQYNVEIRREHFLNGTISIGDNVVLAKNVFIDYSGFVTIGNNVALSDGVAVESHEHPGYTNPAIDIHKAVQKTLVIEDGAIIGAKAVINASVGTIGRYARVGAGTVLRQSVPPYAIVMGCPAKVVGFSMTPEQMKSFEEEQYSKEDRLSVEKYEKDYNKLFLNRIDDIQKYLKKVVC